MEFDPLVYKKNVLLKQSRIILGSFPTWSLTSPDLSKGETERLKLKVRKAQGDFPFFYGSANNVFWHWYKVFIDLSIHEKDIRSIQASLAKNNIGITNIIESCTRKARSSFDYDLSNRQYTLNFFSYPEKNQVLKILCTSKTVLNEMLLSKLFWKTHPGIAEDTDNAMLQQQKLLKRMGCIQDVPKPILRILKVENGGLIECLAIPSPGSPYRGLNYFGKNKNISPKDFLRAYLTLAFEWFS